MAKKAAAKKEERKHPFPNELYMGTEGNGEFTEGNHCLDMALEEASKRAAYCHRSPANLVAVYQLVGVHRITTHLKSETIV